MERVNPPSPRLRRGNGNRTLVILPLVKTVRDALVHLPVILALSRVTITRHRDDALWPANVGLVLLEERPASRSTRPKTRARFDVRSAREASRLILLAKTAIGACR